MTGDPDTMPFKRKIATPQPPKRSSRKARTGKRKPDQELQAKPRKSGAGRHGDRG